MAEATTVAVDPAESVLGRDLLSAGALHVEAQRGHDRPAVAVADELARFACSVWKDDRSYQIRPTRVAA